MENGCIAMAIYDFANLFVSEYLKNFHREFCIQKSFIKYLNDNLRGFAAKFVIPWKFALTDDEWMQKRLLTVGNPTLIWWEKLSRPVIIIMMMMMMTILIRLIEAVIVADDVICVDNDDDGSVGGGYYASCPYIY